MTLTLYKLVGQRVQQSAAVHRFMHEGSAARTTLLVVRVISFAIATYGVVEGLAVGNYGVVLTGLAFSMIGLYARPYSRSE